MNSVILMVLNLCNISGRFIFHQYGLSLVWAFSSYLSWLTVAQVNILLEVCPCRGIDFSLTFLSRPVIHC